MRIAAFILLLAGVAHAGPPTAEQMKSALHSRPEQDEIHWRDTARAPVKCRVVRADEKTIIVEKTLPSGLTSRSLPLAELSAVKFQLTPDEVKLHENCGAAAVPALRVLWDARAATLAPGSTDAARTGFALAKSLRASGEFDEALAALARLKVIDDLHERIANDERCIAFLRTAREGNADAADKLAWEITGDSEDPDSMIPATRWLADRNFAELKKIDDENPRWIEDDEVKLRRERVHHLALDFSLYPSLFTASHRNEAAEGLHRAALIYQFTNETELAIKALEDVIALYPETKSGNDAAALLAKLKSKQPEAVADAPEAEKPVDSEERNQETPAPPPPPKKYNIFGD
ncbi:MAG: tetratricopeptide repeat protein [Verrucomicrobiota bacterium]